MFFNFSRAFDTIQPSLLAEKLHVMQVAHDMVAWITDYISNRLQHVRLKLTLSDVVTESTGAPQGTVLSPFLFTIYTSDFKQISLPKVLRRPLYSQLHQLGRWRDIQRCVEELCPLSVRTHSPSTLIAHRFLLLSYLLSYLLFLVVAVLSCCHLFTVLFVSVVAVTPQISRLRDQQSLFNSIKTMTNGKWLYW